MKEGDLVRVVHTAPRPWANQLGIVVKHQFFFHRPNKVLVYLFKLKEQIPILRNNVILISEVKD
jgi:hypothetical protein